ncbi:GNAT family N-acetyltransferase [Dorea sp. D27]|uniref:GNAT family N-acetyltransferase n=1 Tax=Dorea sp. D27 TaxID=658665 RepID=UPI000673B31E|nr:GNAT family N-acetyltransferase [Dorea sp. D27]KMZ55054.1 GCN5-related N-acetyltransferase [Dorea sp. D27]
MEYRKATAEDIDLISEIRRVQLIHEQAHEEIEIKKNLKTFFEKVFEENRMIQILAEEDGVTAATGAVLFYDYPPGFSNPSGKVAYIANMFTDPDYRRRGLAFEIMDMLVEEARKGGAEEVRLLASEPGRPVYEKYGFIKEEGWYILKERTAGSRAMRDR